MKKKLFLLCLALAGLLWSCDEETAPWVDHTPDTTAPIVTIKWPAPDDSVAIIYRIEINAEIQDNKQLDRVKVLLGEPGGNNHTITDIAVIDFYKLTEYTLSETYYIPKYTQPGVYNILVEASDMSGNVTQQSSRVKLVAHDLTFAAFEDPFYLSLSNSHLLEGLDWYGYNYHDRGLLFDNFWLSTLLFFMVNYDTQYELTEAEWRRFVQAFGLKNQTLVDWDKDSNNYLDDAEFEAGIVQIKILESWDKDQDQLVDHVELASGIFAAWDHNKDHVLSAAEYLDHFYTYLYSKRK